MYVSIVTRCAISIKKREKKMVNLKWDYLIEIFSMHVGIIAEFHLPLFYQDKDPCHVCLKQF